jgi:integrase
MSSQNEVSHKSITLKIKKRTTRVNGKAYTNWEIRDTTSGKLVRHKRASLQEAREKAKEICEAIAGGKREVIGWESHAWAEVRRALEILPPQCLRIDRAAQIIFDALRYVDVDTIVEACRCFQQNNPGGFTPKLGKEVTAAFRARQRGRVSARRARTESSYLNAFDTAFAERVFGGVQTGELCKMADDKGWAKATRNDALNTFSKMYRWATDENWTFTNPATSTAIARQRLGGSDIEFFSPGELRLIFNSVEDALKPFISLWAFTGCRKQEAARLEWQQIDQGLKSGAILLRADQAKTARKRTMPVCDSLRAWLMKYRKSSGLVLPQRFQAETTEQQIQRLDDLSKYIVRRSKRITGGAGLRWKPNGIRDAFALYHLKLHRDPRETVRVMGTSLRRLDENYLNITDSVVLADAEEWFAVMPEQVADIESLQSKEPEHGTVAAA